MNVRLHNRIVLMIQARMNSTRLPYKMIMDLAGATMLQRIIERTKRCTLLDDIYLITTKRPEDLALVAVAKNCGIKTYRGSENNLILRHYRAALKSYAAVIIRVPGDNYCPEPDAIDDVITTHIRNGNDFTSNLTPLNIKGWCADYPDGIGGEVYSFKLLEEMMTKAKTTQMKEHLFPYIKQLGEAVPCNAVPICPREYARPDLILDVNTQADYNFARELYSYLYPRDPNFHITDIIKWYDTVYQGPTCKQIRGIE